MKQRAQKNSAGGGGEVVSAGGSGEGARRRSAGCAVAAAGAGELPMADPVVVNEVREVLPGSGVEEEFFWERRVAAWLGIQPRRLAWARRRMLREGRDWILHEQQVVYTAHGLQRLREVLGSAVESCDAAAPAVEPAAPMGPPKRRMARVERVFPSRNWLSARLEITAEDEPEAGAAGPVLVRVRDNSNFMAGMRMQVLRPAGPGAWQFSGRLPRGRGRW